MISSNQRGDLDEHVFNPTSSPLLSSPSSPPSPSKFPSNDACHTTILYPYNNISYNNNNLNNPHAYPKGEAIYTEKPSSIKYLTGSRQMIPYYGPPPIPHPLTTKDKILRVFILLCCVALLIYIIYDFVETFNIDQKPADFRILFMNVSNLITTPSLLSGEWDIAVLVEREERATAQFSNFQPSIIYKDFSISTTSMKTNFTLNWIGIKVIRVKSWSNSTSEDEREKKIREEIANERNTFGFINLSLNFSYSALVFPSLSSSSWHENIVGTCEGFKVLFENSNATTGISDHTDNPIECRVKDG